MLFTAASYTSQPSSSPNLDPDIEMDLKFILELNLRDIIRKYGSYVDCVRTSIEEKGVTPEALGSYLMSLSAFSSSYEGQKLALMSERKCELERANTIISIFNLLIPSTLLS